MTLSAVIKPLNVPINGGSVPPYNLLAGSGVTEAAFVFIVSAPFVNVVKL